MHSVPTVSYYLENKYPHFMFTFTYKKVTDVWNSEVDYRVKIFKMAVYKLFHHGTAYVLHLLGLNHHARSLLVECDMFSVVPIMDWQRNHTLIFDIKFHDSYLMKCLHNNITQDDTI